MDVLRRIFKISLLDALCKSTEISFNCIVPASAFSRKFNVLRNVVLPLPDGPRITVTDPVGTCRSMPFKISRFPKDL